jgi:hypothetical protein
MWWTSAAAWACAALVHGPLDTAESPGSEVLFERTADGHARVTYNTQVSGDASDFGWIVPLSGDFVAIEEGDPAVFDALREPTAPTVLYDTGASGTCACGRAGKGGGDGMDTGWGVTVVAEGFSGIYEYVILDAEDPTDLEGWLSTHGWTLGDAALDLAAYVVPGAQTAAVRVTPAFPGAAPLASLPTLTFETTGALTYPLRMARRATEPEQRLTVWVRGDGRAALSGWETDARTTLRGDDATEAWEDHLRTTAEAGAWQLTWAGPLDGTWVTRFDAIVPREGATHDPTFDGDTADARTHHVWIDLRPTGSASWLLLPALALGWIRRTRR